jgi:ribonucleoside-diphosphate reductase alpha chain
MDCDTTGVEPDIALVKYKLLAGGGMLKIVNRTVPEALQRLKYTDSEIEQIKAHIEAFDTIEDVVLIAKDPRVEAGQGKEGEIAKSGLKREHLEVFDCAFKAFRGTRSIHYQAHLSMMAAAQPFISGAISKTVNLPADATVGDIRQAYIQAWRMGLKCVAIYRDGSKRSQPLNTNNGSKKDSVKGADTYPLEERVQQLEKELIELRGQLDQPIRRRLPETRMAVNHKFEIAGHEGYMTVGLFDDGQPGELFVTMAKEGSTIGGLMDTIGALTSMSLQYGVPLESLIKKFAHQRFEPSGFTKNPDIRNASSIIDYVFRWMGCHFIAGYRAANNPGGVQEELPMPDLIDALKKKVNRPVPELPLADGVIDLQSEPLARGAKLPIGRTPRTIQSADSHSNAVGAHVNGVLPTPKSGMSTLLTSTFQNQGDAPSCPCCGHIAVRNGACFKCLNCGESLGCS